MAVCKLITEVSHGSMKPLLDLQLDLLDGTPTNMAREFDVNRNPLVGYRSDTRYLSRLQERYGNTDNYKVCSWTKTSRSHAFILGNTGAIIARQNHLCYNSALAIQLPKA